MTLQRKLALLCLLWTVCGCVIWYAVTAHPSTFSMREAHIRPDFGAFLAGLLFLGSGINALYCAWNRRLKVFVGVVALFGAVELIQSSQSYADFGDAIVYRSPFSLTRVETTYADIGRVEVQWAYKRGRPNRLYQTVLHFRGGTTWRSAIDGLLYEEEGVQKLLDVIKRRAPEAPVSERLLR